MVFGTDHNYDTGFKIRASSTIARDEKYIYGLDRIKRAGAITLDIKCVCIYKYIAMYNNNIVLQ